MKPLNSTAILSRLVLPVLLFVGLGIYLLEEAGSLSTTHSITFFVLLVVQIIWICLILRDAYDLYYDNQFLFLRGAFKKGKISLNQVLSIKRVPARMKLLGFPFHQYKIVFDNAIPDQVITVIPGDKAFEDFLMKVRQAKSDRAN